MKGNIKRLRGNVSSKPIFIVGIGVFREFGVYTLSERFFG